MVARSSHRIYQREFDTCIVRGSLSNGSAATRCGLSRGIPCLRVFLSNGSVVTGRGLSRAIPEGVGLGGFDLKTLMIEMIDSLLD